MWNGESRCIAIEDPKFCMDSFSTLSEEQNAKYENLNYQLEEDSSLTLDFHSNDTQIFYSQCTGTLLPTSPYTYGIFFKLTSAVKQNIYISTKEYTEDELRILGLQEKIKGSGLGIATMSTCISSEDENEMCTDSNDGYSEYVRDPRLIIEMEEHIPVYIFVHSQFGQYITEDFQIHIKTTEHVCEAFAEELSMLDFVSFTTKNFSVNFLQRSSSVCVKVKQYVKWYKITGVDFQMVKVDTCNISTKFDTSIQIIKHKEGQKYASCESATSECVSYVHNNCEDLIHSITLFKMESGYTYHIGITQNIEPRMEFVDVHFGVGCINNCGDHGICDQRKGMCKCLDGYVLYYGGCSMCGNGVLDEEEECDNSYKNDAFCGPTCYCTEGTVMKRNESGKFCEVPTCGNNIINDGEECDGGKYCEHCLCNPKESVHYLVPQIGCKPITCGNGIFDVGEECDGGRGCIECQCQFGYSSKSSSDCQKSNFVMVTMISLCVLCFGYLLYFLLLLFIVCVFYRKLNQKIAEELGEQKILDDIYNEEIVPFSREGGVRINIESPPFFTFSLAKIDETAKILEINCLTLVDFTLRNNYNEVMTFICHGVDTFKYKLVFRPKSGRLKPHREIKISAFVSPKCTCNVRDSIYISIRYSNFKRIYKSVVFEKITHFMDSDSSEKIVNKKKHISMKEVMKAHSASQRILNTTKNETVDVTQNSIQSNTDKKVTFFYVKLPLLFSSEISPFLDMEEIEIKHPQIGEGAFGTVFKGKYRTVDVAVKMFKQHASDEFDHLRDAMLQETDLLLRLRCPNVVSYMGSAITDNTCCILTEFCPFMSVKRCLALEDFSVGLKIKICFDVAKGMKYLHSNNIIHYDLKSDNILLVSKNENEFVVAKVCDFGTSLMFVETNKVKLKSNIGTPQYMSPEVIKKNETISNKTDVYSYAITLLELWKGKEIYNKNIFSDKNVIYEFVLAGKRVDIPVDCTYKDLINSCWEQDPAMRPSFDTIVKEFEIFYKLLDVIKKLINTKEQYPSNIPLLKFFNTKSLLKELFVKEKNANHGIAHDQNYSFVKVNNWDSVIGSKNEKAKIEENESKEIASELSTENNDISGDGSSNLNTNDKNDKIEKYGNESMEKQITPPNDFEQSKKYYEIPKFEFEKFDEQNENKRNSHDFYYINSGQSFMDLYSLND
ncbi:serine-threonine protein kinase, putative [Entamoeba invadens IP1]|uniref:Serine-threonine protein kinase, putative n=1 Tax=Entamoeba invadens IP1 TaxID=370355 RepID=A0A0A1U7B0_ENTIV|nr:serine-threonine protein kinase, putative [Entamoeba invadens IP1]ELP87866.1 serine-threonine protein kinase, putative [Entamoeba invadens IP1]|eukprot:XP_004254637.1 serine-threonine protein kinase, putative [Entamoeba invadens IP1]